MVSEPLVHVFLVSFPGQGHVNPLLRLGKRLASKGLLVTFSTTQSIGNQMKKNSNCTEELLPIGDGFIRFEFFDDGWDENDPKRHDLELYLPHLEVVGKEVIPNMLEKYHEMGRPVSCLINNPFIPWVSDLAESLGLPSAMLWVQSCASFSSYYHFFHNSVPFPSEIEPEIDVRLPCMPLLKHDEIPSFLHPTAPLPFTLLRRSILGQFKNLDIPFCILMDTSQKLEEEIIDYMSKICPIKTVGPLFKNLNETSTTIVRGDFVKVADDCIEWLNSKPESSVIYISFGSIVYINQEQIIEIAYGLLNLNVSFLWVLKPPRKDSGLEIQLLPDEFFEKVGEKGKVVQWSPQEQILMHPSISCFVTHCGWNSTMEALTSGVPVVVFPQWGDQVTDAKFLVDIWKVGLRLSRGRTENKLITREKIEKCLIEATQGEKANEMKENALKWKVAAEEAVADGGSSDRNIQEFVDEIRKRSFDVMSQLIEPSNGQISEVIINENN